jgi:outer membrane lipoprotein-sorting protein
MSIEETDVANAIERVQVDDAPCPEHREELRGRVMAMFDRAQTRTSFAITCSCFIYEWRSIMSRPIPRLTAVSLLGVGLVTVGWLFLTGTVQVTYADLVKPILEVKSATFTSTVQREGNPVLTTKNMILEPGHFRSEMPNGLVSIIDLGRKKRIMINSKTKTAAVFELTGAPEEQSSNLFGRLQAHLREAQSKSTGKREELGEKDIDGRRAVGFRVSMSSQVAVLWSDPKSGLPVRIEFSSDLLPDTEIIMTDFVFNVDLDKSLFTVDAPDGYVVRNAEIDQSLPQEKDLIEALRYCSDAADGSFPDAMPTNLKALEALYKELGLNRGKQSNNKQFEETMRIGATLGRGLLAFPAQLTREADAHYAGKGVKHGDVRVPIFWYRPTEGKTYRVVYADLSVGEVSTPPNAANAQALPREAEGTRR